MEKNPYKVLQVDPEASSVVIKAAYRALMKAKEMHPDLGGDLKQAQELNEAYSVLNNPSKRLEWNAKVRHSNGTRTIERTLIALCSTCGALNAIPFQNFVFSSSCGNCGQRFLTIKKPEAAPNTFAKQYRDPTKAKPKAKQNPLSPMKMAVFLFERQLFPRAIEQLQEILKTKENHPEALYLLGMSYYRLQRYRDCTKPFLQLLHLQPDHVSANLHLGKALMRLQEFKDAVPYLKKAELAHKGDSKLILLLANSLFMSDQYTGAALEFAKIVEREPKNENALFLMGMSYFKSNSMAKAFEAFRRGRNIFPQNEQFDRMVKATVDALA